MTLNEFRAWFDGFSEAIGDAPTPEQWAKIKAKVNGLDPLAGLAGLMPQTPPAPPHRYEPYVSPSIMPLTAPRLGEVTCGGGRISSGISSTIARN